MTEFKENKIILFHGSPGYQYNITNVNIETGIYFRLFCISGTIKEPATGSNYEIPENNSQTDKKKLIIETSDTYQDLKNRIYSVGTFSHLTIKLNYNNNAQTKQPRVFVQKEFPKESSKNEPHSDLEMNKIVSLKSYKNIKIGIDESIFFFIDKAISLNEPCEMNVTIEWFFTTSTN